MKKPYTIGIIQARFNSRRLPGKVMLGLNGKPALYRIFSRVIKCGDLDKVILATSTNPENDALERLGQECGWNVFRGSEDDVLSRFAAIVEKEKPGLVSRINADNFAICPEVISHGIREVMEKGLDVCTSFINNTYPFGSGAEVSTAECIMRLDKNTRKGPGNYREHIYSYAYENAGIYRTGCLEAPGCLKRPEINLSVDTAEDYRKMEALYGRFHERESDFGLSDIIDGWDILFGRNGISTTSRRAHA